MKRVGVIGLGDMGIGFAKNVIISLQIVYRPDGGNFEDGFRASVNTFKQIFG